LRLPRQSGCCAKKPDLISNISTSCFRVVRPRAPVKLPVCPNLQGAFNQTVLASIPPNGALCKRLSAPGRSRAGLSPMSDFSLSLSRGSQDGGSCQPAGHFSFDLLIARQRSLTQQGGSILAPLCCSCDLLRQHCILCDRFHRQAR